VATVTFDWTIECEDEAERDEVLSRLAAGYAEVLSGPDVDGLTITVQTQLESPIRPGE
jgi:hypothetical protein